MALDTYLGPPLAVNPPGSLTFTGPFGTKQTKTINVKNPSLMQAALFKVKSTDKVRVSAAPMSGVIGPDDSILLTVTIARFQFNASEKNREKLIVQSTLLKSAGFEEMDRAEFNTHWRQVPPRDLRNNAIWVEFEEGDCSEEQNRSRSSVRVGSERYYKPIVEETPKQQRVMKSKRTLNANHRQNVALEVSSSSEEEVLTTRTLPKRSPPVKKKDKHTKKELNKSLEESMVKDDSMDDEFVMRPMTKVQKTRLGIMKKVWQKADKELNKSLEEEEEEEELVTADSMDEEIKAMVKASRRPAIASGIMKKDRQTSMELEDIPLQQKPPSKSPDKKTVHFGGDEFFNRELKKLTEELRKDMERKQQRQEGYGTAAMMGTALVMAVGIGGLIGMYVQKQ